MRPRRSMALLRSVKEGGSGAGVLNNDKSHAPGGDKITVRPGTPSHLLVIVRCGTANASRPARQVTQRPG